MPVEHRRTDEQIRREITTEREQLANALVDLRVGLYEKRKLAAAVAGALAAGFVTAAGVAVVRRLRGE